MTDRDRSPKGSAPPAQRGLAPANGCTTAASNSPENSHHCGARLDRDAPCIFYSRLRELRLIRRLYSAYMAHICLCSRRHVEFIRSKGQLCRCFNSRGADHVTRWDNFDRRAFWRAQAAASIRCFGNLCGTRCRGPYPCRIDTHDWRDRQPIGHRGSPTSHDMATKDETCHVLLRRIVQSRRHRNSCAS
jgi:hypothetical protein